MMKQLKILFTISLLLLTYVVSGQTYNMTNGSVNTCSGTFYDTGGAGGSYGNNQNLVFTICPNNPGDQIQLDFTFFDIENSWDFLTIYDGNTTGAPTLGTYTGTAGPGTVQATAGNASGCITVEFDSDGSVTYPGWAANISCFAPCQTINANLDSSNPAPNGSGIITICQGDAVTFNGSATFSNSGAGASYMWDFDDGSTANGTSATHTFNNEGVYLVNLIVTDPNGCTNGNSINQVVQVSTTPIFNGSFVQDPVICLGESTTLTGVVTPTPFNYSCTPPVSGTTFLPDGSGVSYESDIEVECFSSAATLTNANQLTEICIDIEHSYLGDLDIVIICPNGQQMDILTYPNGGGGTFLGNPWDGAQQANGAGDGLVYCFDNVSGTTLTNGATQPATNTAGNTIVPGNYAPVGDFNDLVGCPLNGDWTLQITDNLGSDDGYIFQWGLEFDPNIVPGNYSFTPTVVNEQWQSDPSITATNGNEITVSPTTDGNHCYTYEMTDDFGCTYDTTICLTVLPLSDPACPNCMITGMSTNVSACDPNTLTYDVSGQVSFTDEPSNGQLIIEDCNGNQQIFNAPFTSPINYNLTGLPADGNPCDITATFTIDPNCTQTQNYTAPICPCNIDNFTANIGACNPATDQFEITGTVEFTAPPASGQLIVEDCNGNQTSFNAPFTSPLNYTISNIPADGAPCNVTAYFTADATCTSTIGGYNNPDPCSCPAEAGTTSIVTNGNGINNYILCDGDDFTITPNGDAVDPLNVGTIGGSTYDPGLGFLIYSCPPTAGVEPNNDPCFQGALSAPGGITDVNDQVLVNSYPPGTFTNNIVYFVQFTMYNYNDLVYNVDCWDIGDELAVQYLNPITYSAVEDCQAGTVTFTIQGGWPEFNGGDQYTASNLSPGTASFNNTNAGHGGTITISGLVDGDNYSFDLVDGNGCPITVTGGPFQGVEDPSFNYPNNSYCQNDADPTANITGTTGGTFSAAPAGLNIDANTGAIDLGNSTPNTYTVTYTTPDPVCFDSQDFTITILPVPFVDPIADQNHCLGDNTNTVNFTGSAGATFNWVNDNTGTGLAASGTGDINSFTTTGSGTSNITVTPEENGCTGLPENFAITVNPLPTVTAGADQTICVGDNATITAGGANTYTWDNGLGAGASHTVSPGTTTTYEVTGTDANGCVNTDQVTINVNPLPNVDAGVDVDICVGDNTTLTATGASTYNWDNGLGAGASHTVSPGATTTYEVTGTDANGCINTDQVTVTVNPLPNVNAGADVDICLGENTTLTASGASTYNWDNGLGAGASHTVSPGATTTYEVTGTDANGCVNTDQVTVTVNPLPTVTAGADQTICVGDNATITASGASTYTWDNGLGAGASHTVSPGTTTTYEVTGTDANGCVNTDQVTINVNPLPNVDAGNDVDICVGDNTTLTATGASTYTWDNGLGAGASHTVSPGATTTYEVTGTDANGCVNTDQVTVTVNPLPTVNAGADQTICVGDNATITATGAFTYTWDNGLGAGASHTVSPGAMTTYEVTGTDANGCVNTDQITITVNPLPTVSAGTDQTICVGDNATISATGASTYTWDNGLGAGASHTVSPGATTTYEVTGTDANGCENTDQVTINVNPLPTVSAGADQTICVGDNATITATGATTYTWDNGLGAGASHTVSPGATTTYEVTGTDVNGCVNTDQVTINVNPLPIVNAGPDVAICDGDNTTLTATGASTFTWDNGLGVGASHTVSPTNTTTYEATGTDANGCVNTDQVTVTVNPLPNVTISGQSTYCVGQTATISATAGYVSYNWSTGDNTQSIQVTDADNPITVTVIDANGCQNTSAAFSVTEQSTITSSSTIEICDGETAVIHGNVESVAGVYSETFPTATCDSTSNVTLVVNALPNVDAGVDQAVCDDGTQVTLTASGASTYIWDNGLGAGASHTFTPNATVTYEVTGTDANGCVNTDQVTVTLNPLPNVDAGLDVTICDGDNTTLTTTGASTYNWNNGLGAGASHTISPNTTTTYEVTGTDVNGCINTDQVTVTVNPLPPVDAGLDVTICDGDNTTLTATGASTYNWDNGLGAGASHTISPNTTTTYEVTGTDANGCINTDQVTVTVNPLPVVDAGLDATICIGDNTTLTATGASNYTWDNGLGAGASHTISPGVTTTYEVTGTDANGCVNTDQVTVTVNPLPAVDGGLDVTICDGDNTTLTATGASTYTWDNGLGAGASHTVSPITTTTYEVTGTDVNGCINSDQVTVTVNPLPTVDAGLDVTICDGDNTTLTATGASTYTWDNGLGAGASHTVSPGTTTTYEVTGTDANGCINTDQVTVTVNPLPTVDAGLDVTICDGDNTTLTATGATAYTWDNGLGAGASHTITPNATTTYEVTGTDANGCINTNQVTVTVNPQDDPSFNYDAATYCITGADPVVNITGMPGGSFTATPAGLGLDANTGDISLATSSIGNYTVTYTTNGPCPQSEDVLVTITNAPVADFEYNGSNNILVCQNGTNPTLNFINGGSAGTFSATPAGLDLDANNGAIDVANSQPGVYTVTNDINLAGCAPVSYDVTVEINEVPTADISGNYTLCAGESLPDIEIDLTGNGPWSVTYLQDGTPTTVNANNSPYIINGATEGVYTLQSVSDANCIGDVTNNQAVVVVNEGPNVTNLNDYQVCEGETLTINNFTSDNPNSTFSWTNTGTDVGFGMDGFGNIPSSTATNGTGNDVTTTIEVTATANGCPGPVSTFTVEVLTNPAINFTADNLSGCVPLSVNFTNQNNVAGANCEWDFGDGTTSNECGVVGHNYTSPGCYDVSLTVTTSEGCSSSDTYTSYICVDAEPVANFSYLPNTVTINNTEVTFENTSVNATSYEWDFSSAGTSNAENPVVNFPETPGTYPVELVAISDAGCTDTATSVVVVNDELIFYVPNTFTPDGNDYNEVFMPVMTSGFDVYNYELLIFNRWGEIIFESHNHQVGWDGTYRGKMMQDGTYVWKITLGTTETDNKKVYYGHVNLLR